MKIPWDEMGWDDFQIPWAGMGLKYFKSGPMGCDEPIRKQMGWDGPTFKFHGMGWDGTDEENLSHGTNFSSHPIPFGALV